MKSINEMLIVTGQRVSACREALDAIPQCSEERHARLEKLREARRMHRAMVKLYTDPFGKAHQQWVYRFGTEKSSPFAPR